MPLGSGPHRQRVPVSKPRPTVIAVQQCLGCRYRVMTWDGYCVACLIAGYERIVADALAEVVTVERVVHLPAPRDELATVLEAVAAYTVHKPRCKAWESFKKDDLACDCGLSGLLERARALREGG